MDYSAVLYDPIYATLGVVARIIPLTGFGIDVIAIDKTIGVAVGGNVDIQTIAPAVTVRQSELDEKKFRLKNLDNSAVEINGRRWQVKAWQRVPAPDGEHVGDVMLILIEGNDGR